MTDKQTLSARYVQYLRETQNPRGRPLIYDMGQRFTGFLRFSCAILNPEHCRDVEMQLLRAFIPHANTAYDGEIGPAVKAFTR